MSESQSITTLHLQPDNPCNCTITLDGRTVYEVVTTHEPKTVTTLRNAAGTVVGSFEWRDVRSDIVTFGEDGATTASSDWLKKSWMPFVDGLSFKAKESGKSFKWKKTAKGMQLFAKESSSQPIVRFRRATRVINKSTNEQEPVPAELLMDGQASGMMDEVVLSFIVLEKDRRAIDEPAQRQGGFLGATQGMAYSSALGS